MSEETALAPQGNFAKIRALARSDEVLSRFAEVLGPSAPTFVSSVLVAVQMNDALMQCTPASIVTAAMRAATLKLSCDPGLGQAWIIPYWDNNSKTRRAQFQIGYKGMIQLAMRTGKYRYLNVATVWKGQTIVEDQLRGIHTIAGFRQPDDYTAQGFMLYFQLVNGYEKTFYMTVEECLEHGKKYSKSFDKSDGFWKKQTIDMMKKTVLFAGLRRWGYFDPNDSLAMAAARDEAAMSGAAMEDDDFPEVAVGPETSVNGQAFQDMSEGEILGDLNGDPAPKQPPIDPPKSEVSDLRYQPDALKTYLAENAKTSRGAFRATDKGLIAQTLEAALGTPDPKAARQQLQVFLTGHSSLTELNDNWLWSLYTWLKPRKSPDGSGEYICDDMAAREARAALNAAQPTQASLL